MGNLEKNAQSTIPGSASTCRAMDFFMGSANAPRRALGRASATFFGTDRRAPYVETAFADPFSPKKGKFGEK
jgi:hypothetical protein